MTNLFFRPETQTIVFVFFFSMVTKSQSIGTDSRGKDIFDFYKTKSISIPVSSANGSFKINGTSKVLSTTQYFVSDISNDHLTDSTVSGVLRYKHDDSAKLTYAGSWGLNWSLEISNLKSNLSQVATFHPSYAIGLGFGRNIDVFNRWDNVNSLSFFKPTPWNVNIYGKLDNVLIYDTFAKASTRSHPATFGITAEVNTFPLNWVILSASLNYEYSTNLSDLKNYQANKPSYSNADIISLGDFVGKWGDLRRTNNLRVRFSVPIIFPVIRIIQPIQPCIIPYYTCFGSIDYNFKNMIGFFASFLGQEYFRKNDASIVSGAGFGIDWINDGGWSHANIFVSGGLDLYKLFGHEQKSNSMQKKH